MRIIDINCDMGEGIGNEEALMPFINSANIACGYHVGDISTMEKTANLCNQYGVAIGAHPSFNDRENFGRKEMDLSTQEIYELVTQQLIILQEVVSASGNKLIHVKPHGALYNQSARIDLIAEAIAKAVKDFDPTLLLFGLSGSQSINEAKKIGLQTRNEVFADRAYSEDGSLLPRSHPMAMLGDVAAVVAQVEQMAGQGIAETICIHGDGKHAVEFAKAIHDWMNSREA
jgi:5-oxoprolinase (ATP-hydrolysing) subunit A